MVRIRMKRMGRTHRPFYRIGAMESREPRDGKFLEQLGWYDPMAREEGKQLSLDGERVKYWLEKGAQPTDTVRDILGREDLLPTKMKAEWEAKRESSRNRVTARTAVEAADKAVAELEGLDAGDADISAFQQRAKDAQAAAKNAVSKGDTAAAEKAKTDAEAALAGARGAVEEAKKKAEAAAAAEAEAGGEGETAEQSE